ACDLVCERRADDVFDSSRSVFPRAVGQLQRESVLARRDHRLRAAKRKRDDDAARHALKVKLIFATSRGSRFGGDENGSQIAWNKDIPIIAGALEKRGRLSVWTSQVPIIARLAVQQV